MGGKKISDLRVVDLRGFLEKRGLDTKGNKATLVERLTQALEAEGINTEDYLMAGEESGDGSKDKLSQVSSVGDSIGDNDNTPEGDMEGEEDVPDSSKTADFVEGMDVEESSRDTVELKQNSENEKQEEMGCNEVVSDNNVLLQNENNLNVHVDDKDREEEEDKLQIRIVVPTEEDHDALNLTIGEEEEDKFITNAEEHDVPNTNEAKSTTTDGNPDEVNDAKLCVKKLADAASKIFEAESEMSSSADTNDARVDTEGKCNEKSEEGGLKPQRKPKDDDRNTLLVTGLSSQTAATEIKAVFKRHGKIGGVKIMSNAKDPEGSRFALVAVMSSEDAIICIKNLDGFELHGRIIHVDKARAEMLSADWVRKENNREHSKIKKELTNSKKSTPNGSAVSVTKTEPKTEDDAAAGNVITTTTKDTVVAEKSLPSSDNTTTKPNQPVKVERKKSNTSLKQIEVSVVPTVVKSNKAVELPTSTSDTTTKDDVKPSSSKKESKKTSTTSSHKSTEKKETRKEVIPFQRNYSYRRPVTTTTQFRDSRIIRGHPRFRPHEVVSRIGRGGGFPHRRYHDERDEHHQYPFHHRMVRRSRSPLERIPYRRASPEVRRIGRQPELTFEEIYDTRQREKDREMERERREIERRRMEEAEKQRLLDEEFRRLAKERERIEAEKAELKRQKEKMIMEEREKQRLEQAEIDREKELLARKMKNKQRLEDEYAREQQKKKASDDRARQSSYMDTSSSLRLDKEKLRAHPYRREDTARYSDSTGGRIQQSPIRSAPIREHRSPSWEKDRRILRDVKGSDRHGVRERDHTTRREDSKAFPISTITSSQDSTGGRYSYETPSHYSSTLPTQRIVTAITKPLDSYYTGGSSRGNRWPAAAAASTSSSSSYNLDTALTTLRADTSWLNEPSWEPSERLPSRTVIELPERWGGPSGNSGIGNSSRLGIPVAPPPPPIFSNSSSDLTLLAGSSFNNNSGMYASSSYDYNKLPSMSSHRR